MARIKAKDLNIEKKLGKKDLKKVRGGGSASKKPAMLIPLPSPHPVNKQSQRGIVPLPSPHPRPDDKQSQIGLSPLPSP